MATEIGEAFVRVTADTAQAQAQLQALKGTSTAAARGMGTSLKTIGAGLSRTGIAAQSFGRSMSTYVTLPIVGVGAAAVGMANNFNQSFTQIQTLAGDLGVSLDVAKKKVLALSGETAQAPEDLAQALYLVASSGADAANIFPILEASAKGAAVGMGDVETIASLLTSVTNAYADSNLKASEAMDIFTASVRQGKAEPADLANTLGAVVPVAAQMGVSLENVGAALATATNLGVETSRAVTGLRYLLASLQKPTETAKSVMDDYGLSTQQISNTLQKPDGLVETMDLLSSTLDLSTLKGRQAFQTIVGGARGMIVANTLVGASADQFQENFDQITASAEGAGKGLDDAFKKVQKQDWFQLQRAWAKLKVALVDLGNTIIPILTRDVIPVLKDAVDWFENLSDVDRERLVKLAGAIALIGPALIGVGLALRGLGGAIKLISGLGRITGILGGVEGAAGGATGAIGGASGAALAGVTAFAALADAVGLAYLGYKIWTGADPTFTPQLADAATKLILSNKDLQANYELSILATDSLRERTGLLAEEYRPFIAQVIAAGDATTKHRADILSIIDGYNLWDTKISQNTRAQFDMMVQMGDVKGAIAFLRGEMEKATKSTVKNYQATNKNKNAAAEADAQQQHLGASFQETGRQADDAGGKVDNLSDKLRNMPDGKPKVTVIGATAALTTVANITAALVGIPDQIVNLTVQTHASGSVPLADIPGWKLNAAGGILTAQHGMVTRGPVVLAGEGRGQTFAGKGAEAIIPLNDRGIGIIAEAFDRAMGRRRGGGGDVHIHVAGKVERPEDLKRELLWFERSRGW